MNKNTLLLMLGMAMVPTGCTLAPKYKRPAAPVPVEWPSGTAYQDARTATNAPQAQDLKWQEFFSDKRLQGLIETALRNNRDLRLSALNVERARAMYGIQRGELLPSLDAVASGSKQRVPADLSFTGTRAIVQQYSIDLGVFAWEPDFFGRIRSLKASALEEYLATEQARRSAQILLVSSVANAYLALAADRENLILAETTLGSRQEAFHLIQRSYELKLVSELDLYRVQTQVEAARGEAARYRQVVAEDENALALLLGSPAQAELLPDSLSGVTPLKEISPGLPSEVLLRRPDILGAEGLLRAAHADIGAARAAFFPRISLTAAVGTASSELSGLFESESDTWSFSPQISMPLFDTRTWSALKVTKVQREIALAQYEKAIQTAFKEVADALAMQGTVDQQVSAQESLVHAVAETYRLSKVRYDRDLDGYLGVLDAQRSLFAAQQGLVSLRLAKLASQVRLYAVLGGGWDVFPEKTKP